MIRALVVACLFSLLGSVVLTEILGSTSPEIYIFCGLWGILCGYLSAKLFKRKVRFRDLYIDK